MRFWGERFKRDDEEDIWEEFRYWLKNPVTEEEQQARDKEVNNYVNSVLAKMFDE